MAEEYKEPHTLAQFSTMRRGLFRSDSETACDYINRTAFDTIYQYSNYIYKADGSKQYFNTSGVSYNTDVVKYHALIARYNDIFNQHSNNIDETIRISTKEIDIVVKQH